MFSNKFAAIFTALVAAAVSVAAAPTNIVDPPITSPKAGDVWTVGSTQLITWDTSNIVDPTDVTGEILLGTLVDGQEDLDTGEERLTHVLTVSPLAIGFPIRSGAVNVTVPAVAAGDDYIVVLFGDSNNISPTFTITN
ncbi:hypothetical protein C2E23DRAFT_718259 [Lenzites betulinus]|nr:hypothetical protein C2E23DRAFT_718259 [Lenzites betulinus]